MQGKMGLLQENHTYDLVSLPRGRTTMKCKWIFKLKTQNNSLKPKYKARLVVKGFGQKKGVEFHEIVSLVIKMFSIRVALGMATTMDLEVEKFDVKIGFLHENLEEEIYTKQP